MRQIKLSARLQTIADFIEEGASVADIGSDHGYLPVYLALSGKARRIIASDMSAGSLAAARRSAEKYGVSDKIEFVVAPGLSGIGEIDSADATDIDTIVIAGVGGETIIGILEEALQAWAGKKLILQPQTKKDELLRYLEETGIEAPETALIRDRGREYTIFSCNIS